MLNLERVKMFDNWLKRTNTKLTQVNGQRKYGGPPDSERASMYQHWVKSGGWFLTTDDLNNVFMIRILINYRVPCIWWAHVNIVAIIQRFSSPFYHQSGMGQLQEPAVKSSSLIFHGIPTRMCWFLYSALLGHSGSSGSWWTSVVRTVALPMPNMVHKPSLSVPFNCCMVTWLSPASFSVSVVAQRSDSCA